MLKRIARLQVAAAWVAAVIVAMAGSVVAGLDMTTSTGELWFVIAVVPPAVMLLLWRGAPPATVAELLYAVDNPSKDVRS